MAILDFDAKRDLYAVYVGNQDDAPLVNPMANLSRVKWHASLPVVGARTRSIVVNVNPRSWTATERQVGKFLFNHGKTFRPLVIGTAWVGVNPVPTHSAFMLNVGPQTGLYSIVTDLTAVRLFLDTPLQNFPTFGNDVVNIAFDLHVCNMGISSGGTAELPPEIDGIEATSTRFRAGAFDTDDKHFIVDAAGAAIFYKGQSLSIERANYGLGIKQSVAGYTNAIDNTTPFTAPIVRTKAI